MTVAAAKIAPPPVVDALGATPMHAAHGTTLPLSTRLAVGALAGLVATLVTTLVMWRQSYGFVPAYVAASVLWRDPPNRVPQSAAQATHLSAGLLAGIGYEAANVGADRARSALGIGAEYTIAGLVTVTEIAVAAVLVVALYGLYSWLVFPRYGGNAYDTRPDTVRRQWAVSATVYGVGLVVVVGTLYEVLPL